MESPKPSSKSLSSLAAIIDETDALGNLICCLIVPDEGIRTNAKGVLSRVRRTDGDWLWSKLILFIGSNRNDLLRTVASYLLVEMSKNDAAEEGDYEFSDRYLEVLSGDFQKLYSDSDEDVQVHEKEVKRKGKQIVISEDTSSSSNDEGYWSEDDIQWYRKEYPGDQHEEGSVDVPRPVVTHVEAYGYPDEPRIRFFFCDRCDALFVHFEQLINHANEEHKGNYFCRWRYADPPCHLRFSDEASRDIHEDVHRIFF